MPDPKPVAHSPKTLLEWALAYASLGWLVFPVNLDKAPLTPNGFKDATTNDTQIRKWWKKYKHAGIGIATGQASGIVVLDVDLDKPGTQDSVITLGKEYGEFAQDVVAQTGGGGYHVYFKHPQVGTKGKGLTIPNATGLFKLPGIDVRGDGGYVVAPPSRHRSNNDYEWGDGQNPFEALLPECPQYLVGHNKRNGKTRTITLTSQKISEGGRNSALTSEAGAWRKRGYGADVIFTAVQDFNLRNCDPPLPESEVQYLVDHIVNYEPEPVPQVAASGLISCEHTHTGYADIISQIHNGTLKFNHDQGTWVFWRRHWWETDRSDEILQKAIEASYRYRDAVQFIVDEDTRRKAEKFSRNLRNQSTILAGIAITKSIRSVATTSDHWDQNLDLFAVENGVVDLRTGELRAGQASDYMSLHSPIAYDPAAKAPRWRKFLSEVFEDDKSIINFVQKAVGYSLTGRTTEQCLFLLVGRGANGKSVLLDTIRELLGPYGTPAPFSTFERTSNMSSAATNDIARLVGKRFVTASETNAGSALHEARLKSLTGGEAVTARFLHQEFFQFTPQCKIWLGVNHLPRVKDDSDGFWRRVRKIDFPRCFVGDEQDPNLLERLRAELPGILNWALQGAQLWYQDALQTPTQILESTNTYRQDSNPLHDFLTEHCIKGEDLSISTQDLYVAYTTSCKGRSMKTWEVAGSKTFRDHMGKDFKREVEEGGQQRYLGLTLREDSRHLRDAPAQVVIKRVSKGG